MLRDCVNFELIRVVAALAGTGAAAWQDARTSFIDDRIVYSMIAVGALLDFLVFDASYWFWTGVVALAIAGIGFLAYRAGQLGGGDVLLFLGIHLLLPIQPKPLLALLATPLFSAPYPFILSVAVAASLFAAVGSAVWFAHRLRQEKAFERVKASAFALSSSILIAGFISTPFTLAQKVFFTALLLPSVFLVLFKKEIMERVIIKKIRLREIEDEDILALDQVSPPLIKKYGLRKVLTKSEVKKLREIEKKEGIRLWPVCKELPRLGPYVFLALVFCLLAGDLVLLVLFY